MFIRIISLFILTQIISVNVQANLEVTYDYKTWKEIENHPDISENIKKSDKGFSKTLFKVINSYKMSVLRLSYFIERPVIFEKPKKFGFDVVRVTGVRSFIISSRGFLPGEEINVIFKRVNKTIHTVSYIPNPIKGIFKDEKASIEAKLVLIAPLTTYLINLSGFDEGEKLKMISFSEDEKLEDIYKFKGPRFSILYSPGVKGVKGGVGHVEFYRQNGDSISLDFPWDADLLEYLKGEKNYELESQSQTEKEKI